MKSGTLRKDKIEEMLSGRQTDLHKANLVILKILYITEPSVLGKQKTRVET